VLVPLFVPGQAAGHEASQDEVGGLHDVVGSSGSSEGARARTRARTRARPPASTSAASKPLHVVLTRRRPDLRRHAGEISFPGGRLEPGDLDLEETALREAEEEIGLRRDLVEVIAQLPAVSTFATNYLIHPFVGLIPPGLRWRPAPSEVDAVVELSLGALRAGRTRTRLERRGFSFETDAYIVGEHLIWGATARILQELLEREQSLPKQWAPPPVNDDAADA
jgi:8-oxo-dGTP pyrophosphatase MutT (NUDIX family)